MKKDYLKGYTSGLGKSLKSIAELVDGDLRSVSFNEGGKFTEKLERALREAKRFKRTAGKRTFRGTGKVYQKLNCNFPLRNIFLINGSSFATGIRPYTGSAVTR